MIALSGSHRSGKTTLGREFAKKYNWKFVETSVSSIFKELGHDPAENFDFKTRITIQEQVLIRLNKLYREIQGNNVIVDRSPLDLLAYTMAEAIGDKVLPEDQARFERYTADCFYSTNRWFSSLLIVQPGIPLIPEEGKAALNGAYIEHLNSLLLGLTVDGRLKTPHYFIPKTRTDLEERIASVDFCRKRTFELAIVAGKVEGAVIH